MTTASLDWELVKEVADALGVSSNNFHQWKSRGSVPHKWRLPIIKQANGRISAEAFETQREAAE